MPNNNLASYEPSSFCIDAGKLEWEEIGKDVNGNPLYRITKEDFPALMHEWWHYIQDISTSSAQNGFYMLMRDIVCISKVTCSKQGETINVPLPLNVFGKRFNQYRNFYNDYCADGYAKDRKSVTAEPIIEIDKKILDGEERIQANCFVELDGVKENFGLVALQELNAFYAQKVAEGYLSGVAFRKPVDSLPGYPYHLGDMLFDHYGITANLRSKFIISTVCLDSLQAPVVFLKVLQQLKGQHIDYLNQRDEVLGLINSVKSTYSHDNFEAYCEWKKDYDVWSDKSNGHEYIATPLQWYWKTIGLARWSMIDYGDDILAITYSAGMDSLNKLYDTFPAPLIKQDGEIKGTSLNSDPTNKDTQDSFDAALAIWSLRRIYLVLTATKHKTINEYSACPLFEKCRYKYQVDDDYSCQRAPWEVVKGRKKADCPYAAAAHTMGLWQNSLDIIIDQLK